jgi:hypothetical protein
MIRALAKLAPIVLQDMDPRQPVVHLPTQCALDAPLETLTVLPMIRVLAKLAPPVLLDRAPLQPVLHLPTQCALDARTGTLTVM